MILSNSTVLREGSKLVIWRAYYNNEDSKWIISKGFQFLIKWYIYYSGLSNKISYLMKKINKCKLKYEN